MSRKVTMILEGSLSQALPLSWRRKIVLPMACLVDTRSRWSRRSGSWPR